MIVSGIIITPAQRSAAIAAMRGQFRTGKIIAALREAGVSTKNGFVTDVARKLLQHQQQLGKIQRVGFGLYQGARVH